jgi:hypothetical protein
LTQQPRPWSIERVPDTGVPDIGLTGVVLRQLRRVRWRHNAHALQRMAYGAVATAALLAVVVLLLAVRATPPVFVAGSVVAAIALGVALIALARNAAHGWLGRARAAAWVDRTMQLDGRLLTLVDVRADDDDGFVAVLERQTAERLPAWTPARVVPYAVPPGMLAAAFASVALLALAVVLAPRLRPAAPRVVVSDRPMDWVAATGEGGESAETHLLAPGTEQTTGADDGATVNGGGDEPGALQAWLQRELLGDATPSWEDGDASLASAGRRPTADRARRTTRDATGAADASTPTPSADAVDDGTPRATHPGRGDTADGSGDAPGAGGGTDPRLFGDAAADGVVIRDRFELAIAARVRTRQGGPGAPHGDAPVPEPDRHPTLAGGGRTDDPIHRMPVPVAWETLVRRLYVRHAGGPEATP